MALFKWRSDNRSMTNENNPPPNSFAIWDDEPETCATCRGKPKRACGTCGGTGIYSRPSPRVTIQQNVAKPTMADMCMGDEWESTDPDRFSQWMQESWALARDTEKRVEVRRTNEGGVVATRIA